MTPASCSVLINEFSFQLSLVNVFSFFFHIDLNVYCNSKWNMNEQNFDVTVNWTLSSNVAVNNIDYFKIISRQLDGDSDYIVGSYEGLDNVQSQVVIQFNLVLYVLHQISMQNYRQGSIRTVLLIMTFPQLLIQQMLNTQ